MENNIEALPNNEEKKHVNPFLVKKLSQSPEAQILVSELEDLNWQIQEVSWKLDLLGARYNAKKLKYLKTIGYEVSDDEIVKAEKLAEDYSKENEHGSAVC